MVEHLKEYCDKLLSRTTGGKRDQFNAPEEILSQLQKLQPEDFEQSKRPEFMLIRGRFHHLANPNKHETIDGGMVDGHLRELRAVLEFYRGEGSHLDRKPFDFLSHPDLIAIIKRDYRELSLRLFPSHSWKSSVVIAGSILEAILFDMLSGPRHRGAIAGNQVQLHTLIDVAVNRQILRAQDRAIIHQTLRDYRNFIHPEKELRARESVGENEAGLAVHALDVVIDYLQATHTP